MLCPWEDESLWKTEPVAALLSDAEMTVSQI